MKNVKLSNFWDALLTSYWFLPGILALGAVILELIMLFLDHRVSLEHLGWIFTGDAEGAREILSVIAVSMASVAATAFSITIVALQLATSNFGPRLLRNFMRDTSNQLILGTFIGTFIYSLLVLRTIDKSDDQEFIPHLSVTVGILLAVISIAVLIYFIHHASTIIQASHVIQGVSEDLDKAIDRLFPEKVGVNPPANQLHLGGISPDFQWQAYPIKAHRNGYLQAINDEKIMNIAQKYNLLLQIKYRPGKFVVKGCELVMVWPRERINKKLTHKIEKAFILGKERTERQDIEFPLQELVEIALRAISPGKNDPFTTIRCIDRLSAGLCHLVQRQFPSPYRYDDHNQLRVIAKSVTFEGIVDQAFNQIRQDSRTNAAVTIHLLKAIALIATYTQNPQHHEVLQRHADMIECGSHQGLPESQDRQDVQEKYNTVIQALNQNHEIEMLRR
ncbi:MAG: DUF2254 domain-containing protein [Nodularia sp. (in: Bacteria)]|nr:MAG: DUF2254 domain-containing protein [Nodularia sp. (in: cyanobacteria)]